MAILDFKLLFWSPPFVGEKQAFFYKTCFEKASSFKVLVIITIYFLVKAQFSGNKG